MSADPITDRTPAPGIYPGVSRAEYESWQAINVSRLAHFDRSAAHAREAILYPKAPTAAMDLGTATHAAILEPGRFELDFAAAPECDRRTTVGKKVWSDFLAANPDKAHLTADEYDRVRGMRDAVWAHPVASEMLRGGHNEVGIVWADKETGLLCKGLIDHIGPFDGWSWVVDVKKTTDARPHAFGRTIKNLHYGAKLAWYLDGCNAIAPRERRGAWLAVEELPPYGVRIYEPDEEAMKAGRLKFKRWLWLYAEALRTNEWPSYEAGIAPLTARDTEWNQ